MNIGERFAAKIGGQKKREKKINKNKAKTFSTDGFIFFDFSVNGRVPMGDKAVSQKVTNKGKGERNERIFYFTSRDNADSGVRR